MKMLGVEVNTGVYISLISETMFRSLWDASTVPMHQKTSKTVHIHWREIDGLGLVFTAETKGQQTVVREAQVSFPGRSVLG